MPDTPKPPEPAQPPQDAPDPDLDAAERDEAQTLRQAPDNASPGEAAGG